MSDQIALDLFIQDFVNTNKLVNKHVDWMTLVSRRWAEDGTIRIYEFQSSGTTLYARGQFLSLPDADWYRLELTRSIPSVDEHRFDCLRMLSTQSHTQLIADQESGPVIVRLITRNRGLLNIVFVIRNEPGITNPFLC